MVEGSLQVLAGDQRKDVVLTAGIHVETKQCKTLFINTEPLCCCMLSSSRCGLKSTDSGNILAGIREIGLWEKYRELSLDVGVGEEG